MSSENTHYNCINKQYLDILMRMSQSKGHITAQKGDDVIPCPSSLASWI
ncbi:hypothetical protein VCHA37P200_60173 [Vibrio chagasii]|nr:hypothetical protein VCHA36P161_110028 [Vibrio chagasii]CAH6808405.1 hypothetical protein VCHA37O173_110183 [Vibrio chagasii]CAH6808756.1 hypothetical protein VCHA28O22_130101 [Vibrio chagasii]CAH6809229.1 hypothetical protein VCHA29O39_120028 [Vibrio chagasii]CAH6829870.1 hypothetical protein VCHA34P126_160129 [Vibrio chagasii]